MDTRSWYLADRRGYHQLRRSPKRLQPGAMEGNPTSMARSVIVLWSPEAGKSVSSGIEELRTDPWLQPARPASKASRTRAGSPVLGHEPRRAGLCMRQKNSVRYCDTSG